MIKSFFYMFLTASVLYLSACAQQKTPAQKESESITFQPMKTEMVAVPAPQPTVQPTKPVKSKTHSLGIIGAVEPVYFLPMKSAFLARIDTGAQGSSIDVSELQEFEREGKKWVSFDLVNRQTGEKHHFEKRIYRQATIKRQGDSEDRIVVLMTVRMGKEKLTVPFSLADRSKFDYQALIGRNILKGRAIVDTALSKTLY